MMVIIIALLIVVIIILITLGVWYISQHECSSDFDDINPLGEYTGADGTNCTLKIVNGVLGLYADNRLLMPFYSLECLTTTGCIMRYSIGNKSEPYAKISYLYYDKKSKQIKIVNDKTIMISFKRPLGNHSPENALALWINGLKSAPLPTVRVLATKK